MNQFISFSIFNNQSIGEALTVEKKSKKVEEQIIMENSLICV